MGETQYVVVGILVAGIVITYQTQIFAQNAYTISIPQSFTRSFNSLPTLKKGSFFGLILTRSPVFGLRPVYPSYSFTKNEHNPPDLHPIPFGQGIGNSIKKYVNNDGGFGFG